jgi:hypothetical protein
MRTFPTRTAETGGQSSLEACFSRQNRANIRCSGHSFSTSEGDAQFTRLTRGLVVAVASPRVGGRGNASVEAEVSESLAQGDHPRRPWSAERSVDEEA